MSGIPHAVVVYGRVCHPLWLWYVMRSGCVWVWHVRRSVVYGRDMLRTLIMYGHDMLCTLVMQLALAYMLVY